MPREGWLGQASASGRGWLGGRGEVASRVGRRRGEGPQACHQASLASPVVAVVVAAAVVLASAVGSVVALFVVVAAVVSSYAVLVVAVGPAADV